MLELSIKTTSRIQMVSLDHLLNDALRKSGVTDGVMTVFVPHTTAAVTINENADPSVQRDMISHLSKLIPDSEHFTHSEGNSDAHIKSSLVGCSTIVIVENGRMQLGTWQSVFFCEFDGPRNRKVWVKFL
jgi:secondary thiamine-phosphate synthase enzyme